MKRVPIITFVETEGCCIEVRDSKSFKDLTNVELRLLELYIDEQRSRRKHQPSCAIYSEDFACCGIVRQINTKEVMMAAWKQKKENDTPRTGSE